MKIIETNSFVNFILKFIKFYIPSSKIFSTVTENDAQKRMIIRSINQQAIRPGLSTVCFNNFWLDFTFTCRF